MADVELPAIDASAAAEFVSRNFGPPSVMAFRAGRCLNPSLPTTDAARAFIAAHPGDDLYFAIAERRDAVVGKPANPARKTAEGLALASEVRAHMKGMKRPEDRSAHAMRAIEAEDKTTVAAILHAPAYLSGLTDEAHALVRARAAAKFAPLDSAQLDATEAAIRQVMNAGSALTRRYGDVLALRSAPAARAATSLRALGAAG